MLLENLESRRFLTATLNDGVLTVTGTAMNDAVAIFRGPNQTLLVLEAVFGPGGFPAPPTVSTFPLADVESIVVNSLAGNDVVTIGRVRHPSTVADLNVPATVNGGTGNDLISGGLSNDQLNGEAGNDAIYGGRGDDELNGGDGRDTIIGGHGADVLSGGNGNDVLMAVDGSGNDTVDGGDHDPPPTSTEPGDVAFVDSGDIVTNVELVHVVPSPIFLDSRLGLRSPDKSADSDETTQTDSELVA